MTIEQVLQKQINAVYGDEDGKRAGKVLIPAFLGDFRKVIEKSAPGNIVSEEYMTEDKKMHIVFKGMRTISATGFDIIIVSCICNGRELLTEKLSLFNEIGL